MKLISWNVNGIRANLKNGFKEAIKKLDPDILCLQETKAHVEQVDLLLKGYEHYWNSAERKGYSGTAIFTKHKPLSVKYGMGIEKHDKEGRVLTLEFKDFFIVTVYTPNSQKGLLRLDYRQEWDKDFREYMKKLDKKKPVIACGDLNCAHQPIDLKNAKANYNKTAGYTQKEIDGFTKLLEEGFIDTFRELHPEKEEYSWWSYMFNARQKNIGWRIDYFIISKRLKKHLKSAFIKKEIMGSDHCPVGIEVTGLK